MAAASPVEVRRETVTLPTYEPHAPDPNPMFLEKRVYQGSSGRVYPLPFTDRVAERARPRAWDAVFIENAFIEVMILPALGGRIHRLRDKTNNYDAIYYQPVIKPALVGLAGPWVSGGIEFNWPQHHRPSTCMPADVAIEHHTDGAATVWLSEHDPMARMKGMHGVRLHPDRSLLELVVRAYNRTTDVQTFLWWANVATRVHERYQSFFPPDATYVADHAKRAMTTFPHCADRYYGVDYAARRRAGVPATETPRQFGPSRDDNGAPDDLSWYANIPVPTSYMCMGTRENFFGGYDHAARAGIIHVADHHISPGKKQWTWGNHEFGYAWDRNLTDPDANGVCWPYIEIMAGVFTDNQPDFSFLQPGETKTWSQFWYPVQQVGPAQQANTDAAVSLGVRGGVAQIGVAVTQVLHRARVQLDVRGRRVQRWTCDLAPDRPFCVSVKLRPGTPLTVLRLAVLAADDREVIAYTPAGVEPGDVPAAATEPLPPREIKHADQLFLTGLHLEQYRHATRAPEAYWQEALRRDPGDARCNLALGRWHLRRGEFAAAEVHLRASIARQTERNPNPYDGEAHYQLGRCLVLKRWARLGAKPAPRAGGLADAALLSEAYATFYKATWNHAWQAAGFHALAEIDCTRGAWSAALEHLERALRVNADNLRARDLQVIVLRKLGRTTEAEAILAATLALDPLDWWARHLRGDRLDCDTQVRLDLALDCARAGLAAEALTLLAAARPEKTSGTAPLVCYYRAWCCHLMVDKNAVRRWLAAGAKAAPEYCFPARLEEMVILEWVTKVNPRDARAPFYLGNLLYDRRRHREAIAHWTRAVRLEPRNAVAWRNLGIARCNVLGDPRQARLAYQRARRANPGDARLLFEQDQLWKRTGENPVRRLRELERHLDLVGQRDDLSIELSALFNQTGQPERALAVLRSRRFQPWEGGEGQVLGQHVRTHLALGRQALRAGRAGQAIGEFCAALDIPENLGEARHLLANQSDVHYWVGCAFAVAAAQPKRGPRSGAPPSVRGPLEHAAGHWKLAADFRGDFQGMSVRTFSEMTYFSALALEKLGRTADAKKLLRALLAHARQLERSPATIDYFATSLPTLLLFNDDLAARQKTTALFLQAQARLGLGARAVARRLLRDVLTRDPNHAPAADLLADL